MKNFEKLISILIEGRKNKDYSFRQVGMFLKHKGVKYTFTSLKKLEDRKTGSISPKVLKSLAEIYDLDMVELFKLADFLDEDYEIEKIQMVDIKKVGFSSFEKINFNNVLELYETNELYNKLDDNKYIIKMKDESMQGLEDKNIPNGAYLVIDPDITEDVEDLSGEICIFKYIDKFYIRELQVLEDRMFLRAFNKRYIDIMITETKDLKCEGKVTKCYFVKDFL